jgi:hypothetical protein
MMSPCAKRVLASQLTQTSGSLWPAKNEDCSWMLNFAGALRQIWRTGDIAVAWLVYIARVLTVQGDTWLLNWMKMPDRYIKQCLLFALQHNAARKWMACLVCSVAGALEVNRVPTRCVRVAGYGLNHEVQGERPPITYCMHVLYILFIWLRFLSNGHWCCFPGGGGGGGGCRGV